MILRSLRLACLLLMCLFPTAIQAIAESRATVLFLLEAASARSHGMGGTGTALANGGTAAFLNPAGVANHDLILDFGIPNRPFYGVLHPPNVERCGPIGFGQQEGTM